MNELGNYLGIDWGEARVGVSFAERETGMAFTLATLKNDDTLFDRCKELIEERGAGTIIIGVPPYVHFSSSASGGKLFGHVLEKNLPVKVFFHDEMFTTKMAQENLKERGSKNIASLDDAEAARIILQEWLDKERSSHQ